LQKIIDDREHQKATLHRTKLTFRNP